MIYLGNDYSDIHPKTGNREKIDKGEFIELKSYPQQTPNLVEDMSSNIDPNTKAKA